MAMLNLRYVFPDALVDINNLFDLAGIDIAPRAHPHRRRRRAACDRARRRPCSRPCRSSARLEAASAHRQTRESRNHRRQPLPSRSRFGSCRRLALPARREIEAAGPEGARRIPVGEFIAGYMMPGIGPERSSPASSSPPGARPTAMPFIEFARRHGDFGRPRPAALLERCTAQGIIERDRDRHRRHRIGPAAPCCRRGGLLGSDGGAEAIAAALDSLCRAGSAGRFPRRRGVSLQRRAGDAPQETDCRPCARIRSGRCSHDVRDRTPDQWPPSIAVRPRPARRWPTSCATPCGLTGHPSRLRARRLRRLHGPGRRRCSARPA